MDYKIIDFNENTGQIVIEYGDDYSSLAIDLPIEDGVYIVGAKLNEYIKNMIPVWHFDRLNQIKAGIPNSEQILSLVQSSDKPVAEINNEYQRLEQQKFENFFIEAALKYGVINIDPRQIPVASL